MLISIDGKGGRGLCPRDQPLARATDRLRHEHGRADTASRQCGNAGVQR